MTKVMDPTVVRQAKAEIEKLSALWIAETRENEKLRADLASIRSVYDFAALEAKITELRAAVLATRALVSEAALTGFNCKDGDWAERLFANQAALTDTIKPRALEQKAGEKKS